MKRKIFTIFYCASVIALYTALTPVYGQATRRGAYKVSPKTLNPQLISPWIYGHFIELGFGRQIEGMWSEKLYNPSFETVEPYKTPTWGWLGKTASDDLSKEEWWHSGYERVQWFAVLMNGQKIQLSYPRYSGFYHGLQAVTLDNRDNSQRAFLGQDSIWIKKGVSNIFKGAVRVNRQAARPATGVTTSIEASQGPVTVTIGLYPARNFSKPLVEKKITVNDAFYREYTVELDAGSYEGRATFAVSIDPGTSASFDGFSLMPSDNIKGWRRDVIAALKQIGVPLIRWPGGCFISFYNWRDGIGPKSERMPLNSEYWGDLEENNVGTAEFVEMCNMVGAVPFIAVNMLTGTAADAADWVAYNNLVSGHPMAELRKSHGYTAPLTTKYWELDNETSRRWGYEEYASKCVEYSKAMKAVDSGIELVMVYYSFRGNLKGLLDIAGEYIDLVTDRSGTESALQEDLATIRAFNKEHGTNIKLCNTEWLAPRTGLSPAAQQAIDQRQINNVRLTRQQHQISWNYAMNAVYQLFTFQRLGGEFLWSNFNNMANTWGQNIIECPRDTCFISCAGRIYELMSKSNAAWVLKTDTISAAKGVFVQSTTNEAKDKLILYMLNYQPSQSQLTIDLSAFKVTGKSAMVKTLNSAGPFSANTSSDYDKVISDERETRLSNARKPVFTLKPWSVTEITLTL